MSQPQQQPHTITKVLVAVQSDFMQRQANTSRLQALAECVWNGLDADAGLVEAEEIAQVEGYVGAITSDSRFDTTTTKWFFWALSKEVDPGVLRVRQIPNAEPGVIIKQDTLVVMVKTWGQVIGENRVRLKFFREGLQHTVTKVGSLRHLKLGYAGLFEKTPMEAAINDVIASGATH